MWGFADTRESSNLQGGFRHVNPGENVSKTRLQSAILLI